MKSFAAWKWQMMLVLEVSSTGMRWRDRELSYGCRTAEEVSLAGEKRAGEELTRGDDSLDPFGFESGDVLASGVVAYEEIRDDLLHPG